MSLKHISDSCHSCLLINRHHRNSQYKDSPEKRVNKFEYSCLCVLMKDTKSESKKCIFRSNTFLQIIEVSFTYQQGFNNNPDHPRTAAHKPLITTAP